MKTITRSLQLILASVALAGWACTAEAAPKVHHPAPSPAVASGHKHVKNAASRAVARRRKHLAREAVIANSEIIRAIGYLKHKDTRHAFRMLTKADGQLSVLLARDPKLKMAPIDVRVNLIDIELKPAKIKQAVKAAKLALAKNDIQDARELLGPLASEMHVDTDYLPLDTYPKAIKLASKQIQAHKLKAAEGTLEDALSSIVTSEDIVPLPPLVAEGDLLQAKKMLKKHPHKDKKKVMKLLNGADTQLADAEALGYGSYQLIHKEIASIKHKVAAGGSKPDMFDRVEKMLKKLGNDNS